MGKIKATDIQDLGLAITRLGCMRSQVQILSRRPTYTYKINNFEGYGKTPCRSYYLILSQFISIWLEAIRGKLGVVSDCLTDLFADLCTQISTAFSCAQLSTDHNPTTPSITKSRGHSLTARTADCLSAGRGSIPRGPAIRWIAQLAERAPHKGVVGCSSHPPATISSSTHKSISNRGHAHGSHQHRG